MGSWSKLEAPGRNSEVGNAIADAVLRGHQVLSRLSSLMVREMSLSKGNPS